jgi:NAD(P)-dependent dehydrogenase (short-subunit alcohol dehydrogenase family)
MTCQQRHVVVTGAGSGIGLAAALTLVNGGQHVFAGVHSHGDEQTLTLAVPASAPGTLTPVLLDVTDDEQRRAAAELVGDHVGGGGLNGLVNNAGIGVAEPLELVSLDVLRHQLEVNVIGQLAVTQAFLPLLRQAQGRIVVIGSIGDRITMPFAGPLTASKRAVAAIADTLRQELAPWNVTVVLIEPASINTAAVDKLELDAKRVLAVFTPAERALYGAAYEQMTRAAVKLERAGSPPEVVAKLIGSVLLTSHPKPRYLIGKGARPLAVIAALAPTSLLDALRRRLLHLPAPGSATHH